MMAGRSEMRRGAGAGHERLPRPLLQLLPLRTLFLLALLSASAQQCELEVREVPGMGLGVFAGRDWEAGQLEAVRGVPVPLRALYHSPLLQYAEALNRTHGIVLLGYAMVYNHWPVQAEAHVHKQWAEEEGQEQGQGQEQEQGQGQEKGQAPSSLSFLYPSIVSVVALLPAARGEQLRGYYVRANRSSSSRPAPTSASDAALISASSTSLPAGSTIVTVIGLKLFLTAASTTAAAMVLARS
ncbi:hypothetical protein B484DRAFT_410227 [Ochromonadaceae sp. CCMP2298]|nr:hypothetical protein B484DRAFT_410227 [Ochromonadaceae sp. CCMP2298]